MANQPSKFNTFGAVPHNAQPDAVSRGAKPFDHVAEITLAVAETIRDLKEVPSGHLYAILMDRMTIDVYDRIIDALKAAGVIEERNHLLRWIGPAKAARS